MKKKGIFNSKYLIYILLVVIAVVVLLVVAFTSMAPGFYLKSSVVSIEIGESFDPEAQISRVKNIEKKDIEISGEVNNQLPGEYEITYSYLFKTASLIVKVEDKDSPVFTIKDKQDYYMSADFDINNIVVDITDKTGVKSFNWEIVSGGLTVPGEMTIKLTAEDAYGHATVNTATVNVIDDILPELVIKSSLPDVEAGSPLDPMIFVEKATDNTGEVIVSYEISSGSINKVGKVNAIIYAQDTAGNTVSREISFKVVDTTAPVIVVKSDKLTHKMSQSFDPSPYVECSDNTGNTKLSYSLVSGDFQKVGTVKVEIKAEDDYGNVSSTTVSVEVQDDIPPEFTLTREAYIINLGRYFDVDSIIASAYDNSGEVSFSYKVSSGTLQHAGECIVDIICTDKYGNSSVIPAPFTIIDKVAPVLTLKSNYNYYIIGDEFTIESLILSCTDNDEVADLSIKFLSGDINTPGDAEVEITAMDPSGNSTSQQLTFRVKERQYRDFGTELNVEITGRDDQPYFIAVNRYMGVVTVYGKDENGDYTVPVKAMLCSVGANSALEENFGVRSGDGLTPLGVYDTIQKNTWGTLFSNDNIHTYVYGQYTTRIVGHILFHSVPYYWQRKDALEWNGDLENFVHEFNKLGSPASMGCIRLCVADVKWIWDNCPLGMTVVIYDERDNYGPLGRPENFIIDLDSEMLAEISHEILELSGSDKANFGNPDTTKNPLNWDPTDPDPENPWIPILEAWKEKQEAGADGDDEKAPDNNPLNKPDNNEPGGNETE